MCSFTMTRVVEPESPQPPTPPSDHLVRWEADDGDWLTGTNWEGDAAPSSSQFALFDRTSAYTITLRQSENIAGIEARAGQPTIDLSNAASPGQISASTVGSRVLGVHGGATLSIENGPLNLSGHASIGCDDALPAAVSIGPDAGLHQSPFGDRLYIGGGSNGRGTLIVQGSSCTLGGVIAGRDPGSRGTIDLDASGQSSSISATALIIGEGGEGTVNMTGAGTAIATLTAASLTFGDRSGSVGTGIFERASNIHIEPVGGVGRLRVGQFGQGILSFGLGASLTYGGPDPVTITVGGEPGGNGRLDVAQTGSRIGPAGTHGDGILLVAPQPSSTGVVTVSLGGEMTVARAAVGRVLSGTVGGTANLSVIGGSFHQTLAGNLGDATGLLVGNDAGTGVMNVLGGGTADCTFLHVSGDHAPAGALNIQHANSIVTCSGDAVIAGIGSAARMTIGDNARLFTNSARIGVTGIGPGRVDLAGGASGLGTRWTIFGDLTIGGTNPSNSPAGTITFAGDARIFTNSVTLGLNYSIQGGASNNPRLVIGTPPRATPPGEINTQTLILSGAPTFAGVMIELERDATVGGDGTWPAPLTLPTGGTAAPGNRDLDGVLTVGGHYVQPADATLLIGAGAFCGQGCEVTQAVGSRLQVEGTCQIDGTLRLTLAVPNGHPYGEPRRDHYLIGTTAEIITADSVIGEFDQIEIAPGFFTNRVSVQYEPARVLVTFLPPGCEITAIEDPENAVACRSEGATFQAMAEPGADGFGAPVVYRWQWYDQGADQWNEFPESGEVYGPTSYIFAVVQGAHTSNLTISARPTFSAGWPYANAVPVRCLLSLSSPACASVATAPALWHVCLADFSCDRQINSQDFFDFIAAFFALQPASDFNADGFINSQDYFDFLAAFFSGC